jgi:hypothetical protein
MKLFVDCEFNGFGGALLSMAIVPEDESIEPFYEVIDTWETFCWDAWVYDNVKSVFGKDPISKEDFRYEFLRYLRQFDNPTVCADWYTDLVHFFSMFAGKDHTKSVGYACKAELVLIEDYHSEIPHNALSDARAIREAYITFTNGDF